MILQKQEKRKISFSKWLNGNGCLFPSTLFGNPMFHRKWEDIFTKQ